MLVMYFSGRLSVVSSAETIFCKGKLVLNTFVSNFDFVPYTLFCCLLQDI